MDFKYNVARTVTVVGISGVVAVHGWGIHQVADQSHIEIDIQPPQHVRSTVIAVSGSPSMAASATIIWAGSKSFLLTQPTSSFFVRPL